MALVTWSDDFLIGDPTIDAEHRHLFQLINEFHSQWLEKEDRGDIARVLHELVRYAEVHFRNEEALMAEAGYPTLADHRLEHERLFETIFRLHADFVARDHRLESHTMRFVRDWLVNHIVQSDFLFRNFLRAENRRIRDAQPGQSAPGSAG